MKPSIDRNQVDSIRKKLILLFLIYFIFEFVAIWKDISVFGLENINANLTRTILTLILMYFVYQGRSWARIIMLILSVLSVIAGTGLFIYTPNIFIVFNIFFNVFVMFYLSLSKEVNSYFHKGKNTSEIKPVKTNLTQELSAKTLFILTIIFFVVGLFLRSFFTLFFWFIALLTFFLGVAALFQKPTNL